MNPESSTEKKTVLHVKGSYDRHHAKTRLGDCFKCHKVFLFMRLKHLDFTIHYIDELSKNRDDEYKELFSTMTPVLEDDGIELSDADEIVKYLEGKHPSLTSIDVGANALASKATPMSSLAGWIKNTDPNREEGLLKKLNKTLGEIDQVLGSNEGVFIDGDELKIPDCTLLPKLYHANIAAKYVKDYDITKEFHNIGKYLDAALKNKVFQETRPMEVEIREKWRRYRK